VIVDEAHLIPTDSGTMYRNFLEALASVNPGLKVLGLTATAYRTGTGLIYGKGELFERIAYEAKIADLIDEGFLSPIVNSPTATTISTTACGKRAGEFIASDLAQACDREAVVGPACSEVLRLAADRRAILVFGVGVAHAERITQKFCDLGVEAECISGDTPHIVRAGTIERFRSGKLRVLVNCQVLTTGFDATVVDCVAVMRPTCSPGLFYQMVGRGLRLHPGKPDCLLLDYGGNIQRHGALDHPLYGFSEDFRNGDGDGEGLTKECPSCGDPQPIAARECACGWLFPESTVPIHEAAADTSSTVIGTPPPPPPEWLDVERIEWHQHLKRTWKEGDPTTLRVEYYWRGMAMTDRPVCEWICIEHGGWVRHKAEEWWSARCLGPCPLTVLEALVYKSRAAIADTPRVLNGKDAANPRYDRITDYELGDPPPESEWLPVPEESEDVWAVDDDDIPF